LKLFFLFIIFVIKLNKIINTNLIQTKTMLLTPQHRRSSRVSRRALTKTPQQIFDEKIANGTMTKEELESTPTCLRHFDEREEAIEDSED